MATFPTGLNTFTNPVAGDVVPSAATGEAYNAIEAIEAKIGTGASTPVSGEVLTGNGTGTSAWTAPAYSHDHSTATYGTTLSPAGGINFSSVITPTALSGDVDNYNPNGGDTAFLWRLGDGGAARIITGIAAPSVGGAMHWIHSIGTSTITFAHNSASSTAANRFLLPNNSNMVISASDSILILYDSVDSLWKALGGWA